MNLNKKYSWVKRVCVVDSAYSLLIYLLISNEIEIKRTFFFWGNGVPDQVRKYFSKQSFFYKEPKRFGRFYRMLNYHILFPFRWPFLCNKKLSVWGHDHLPFSSSVIRNNKINIIEDGIRNYYPIKVNDNKFRKVLCLLWGPASFTREFCYLNNWCKNEYLTGIISESQAMSSSKIILVNLAKLWSTSSESKKNMILEIYDLKDSDLFALQNKTDILLTQPYSEDKVLTENEKVDIYKKQLLGVDFKHLIIKPHPREVTDYKKYFPNCYVFTKKIPLELLRLCGINFNKAFTIDSTAIYNFPESTVKIIWGARISSKITSFQQRIKKI